MEKTEKRGFMSSRFFDSAIKSPQIEGKERILGYLVGPIGAYLINYLVVTYLTPYYTDVLGLTAIANGDFLFWFPLASSIMVILFNLLFGFIVDRTKTKQGKARPYLFLSAFLLPLSSALLYLIPTDNQVAELVVVVLTYNLFFSIAYAIYNTAHSLMVPLSTRNSARRNVLSTLTNLAMMIAQGLASFIFPTFIYNQLGTDKNMWFIVMLCCSMIALPLTLCEYYFTRERVTEENQKLGIREVKVPIKDQLKVCFKDKYWWLIIAYFFIFQFGLSMKNSSVIYYCNWVLGTYQDGLTIMLFNIVGGLSLGIGAVIITPLTKKFSKRWLLIFGFIFYSLGDILCWIFPTNLPIVLVGQFVKNAGAIPCVYILMSLYSDVLDHLEWKAGFRCDGFSTSLYTTFLLFFPILGTAIFTKLLAGFGYIAPSTGDVASIVQNDACKNMMTFCCVGVEAITSIIIAVLFIFLDVEKGLKKKQEEIVERQKAAVIAQGGVWIEPAVREQQEQDKIDKEAEEMRIDELHKKCDKKGLNFDDENNKYLAKIAEKKQKEEAKKAKKVK